jgi:hypothetical protein
VQVLPGLGVVRADVNARARQLLSDGGDEVRGPTVFDDDVADGIVDPGQGRPSIIGIENARRRCEPEIPQGETDRLACLPVAGTIVLGERRREMKDHYGVVTAECTGETPLGV